ncbi:MAG: inositol monophosphatase [Phycisphaerae bacterium]
MHTFSLPEALAFAQQLARQAAAVTRSLTAPPSFQRKADNSPVTEADRRIQRIIAQAIAERYPDHAFLGEETIDDAPPLPAPGQSDYCWVVDPLDGTRNFTHGFPIICTSIALLKGPQPIVGLIHEHNSGWQCSAVQGGGVTCCGTGFPACRMTGWKAGPTPPDQSDIIIAVPSARNQPTLPVIRSWLDKYVLRNVGCTALHMAYVATGAVDAAHCLECKLWDVAAGYLLITAAGGRCTDLSGHPLLTQDPAQCAQRDFPFFAASPAVYDQLFNEMNGA